jgi:hypothetical protein
MRYYDWDKEHKYPHFDSIGEKVFYKRAKSLEEAHIWMMENHPEWSVGCNIVCLNNTDFLCDAVLDYYYLECGMKDPVDIADMKLTNMKQPRTAVTMYM